MCERRREISFHLATRFFRGEERGGDSQGLGGMASQLSRAVAKKLYSLGAGGTWFTLGFPHRLIVRLCCGSKLFVCISVYIDFRGFSYGFRVYGGRQSGDTVLMVMIHGGRPLRPLLLCVMIEGCIRKCVSLVVSFG